MRAWHINILSFPGSRDQIAIFVPQLASLVSICDGNILSCQLVGILCHIDMPNNAFTSLVLCFTTHPSWSLLLVCLSPCLSVLLHGKPHEHTITVFRIFWLTSSLASDSRICITLLNFTGTIYQAICSSCTFLVSAISFL